MILCARMLPGRRSPTRASPPETSIDLTLLGELGQIWSQRRWACSVRHSKSCVGFFSSVSGPNVGASAWVWDGALFLP